MLNDVIAQPETRKCLDRFKLLEMIKQEFKGQGTKYQVFPNIGNDCRELGGLKVTSICACMSNFCTDSRCRRGDAGSERVEWAMERIDCEKGYTYCFCIVFAHK